jgi:hypothetical protein
VPFRYRYSKKKGRAVGVSSGLNRINEFNHYLEVDAREINLLGNSPDDGRE